MIVSKRIVMAVILTVSISFSTIGQEIDQQLLQRNARRGDPDAMYELGISMFKSGEADQLRSAYSLIKSSAEKEYAPSQAALAYFYKMGLGVGKDLTQSWVWTQKAMAQGDGLGYWLASQIAVEKGFFESEVNHFISEAYNRDYPIAKLYFSKLYSTGSASFDFQKDIPKSQELLRELAKSGVYEAAALYGAQVIRTPSRAFEYLKIAADAGMSKAMNQVANMYYFGEGVSKNEASALAYYQKSADLKDPSGMEGLADCYRVGAGTGVFLERAFNLYNSLENQSPRVKYILGCYFSEGVSTAKDTKKAIQLFESSASMGNVFAQALLGTSLYEGVAPFEAKDFDKAYLYLNNAMRNEAFDDLPANVASKVLDCVARCLRFGRGGAPKNREEADRLQKKAEELSEKASSQSLPFASIGLLSRKESVKDYDISWDSDLFADILDKVTFDYPKEYINEVQEVVPVQVPSPVVEEKPKAVASEKPKASAPKSGRVACIIEAVPYGFGPTTYRSSRDNNIYWINGQVIGLSASVGWLSDSGLFVGAGAGFDSYTGGRMTVINGFVDARYFMNSSGRSGLFLGAQGGVAYGTSEIGIGLGVSGLLGYSFSIGGNTSFDIGLKAGTNSFSDTDKSKAGIVGPTVGIRF